MVATPLWFKENKERLKSIGEDQIWIQPSEIAEVLYDVCVNPAHKGGTIIEASGEGRTRQVEVFNDPGPPGAAQISSDSDANDVLDQEIHDMLLKEKGSN